MMKLRANRSNCSVSTVDGTSVGGSVTEMKPVVSCGTTGRVGTVGGGTVVGTWVTIGTDSVVSTPGHSASSLPSLQSAKPSQTYANKFTYSITTGGGYKV